MSKAEFGLGQSAEAPAPHHYTACGLDNIYLTNGFVVRDTRHGRGCAIEGIDQLHVAIARHLTVKATPLTGKELRYLRRALDLTQEAFADLVGSDVQNIGRYERGAKSVPGPIDRLARITYRALVAETPDDLEGIVQILKAKPAEPSSGTDDERPVNAPQFFRNEANTWTSNRAA